MENKIEVIKSWLETGSINIFGLPMSGKDTQGIKLAEMLNAKFLSSGMIIRAKEKESKKSYSNSGALIPTNIFYEWVLPFLEHKSLLEYPLILSSIGRWSGEETQVMSVAASAGHPIKAVVLLNISENEAKARFEAAKTLGDRGEREDDKDLTVFETRLEEFKQKTTPVLQYYQDIKLLININGNQSREAVFEEIINKLYERATKNPTY